ncbi:MAG: HDOD domain-containing protein [Desulfobacterales bacterium]|nr:HDOD domain-containing protein [Desulfobacterales bacterium]
MASTTDKQINVFFTELVSTLVSVIEQKDVFMRGHAERIASYCTGFTRMLKLSEQAEVDKIYFAALLHDIGMVYLPLEILQKTGKLNDEELSVIKKHPVLAENVLSNMTILKGTLPMIRHHHEAFDGSGYPDGLRGADIPLGARIIAIADSYDALTSVRPHRPAIDSEQALAVIQEKAGQQYDRGLVNRFARFIRKGDMSIRGRKTEEPTKEKGLADFIDDVIEKFKKGNVELPVLPQVVHDVQAVMREPNSSSEDLANVIEKDAVISVRLTAVANSPYYRGIEQITSVRSAISRLGLKETQNLITAIANKNLYETKNFRFRKVMENLWVHSLAVGYASVALAKVLGASDEQHYFFMGIVHDIGKVVLLKALSETIPAKSQFEMPQIKNAVQEIHAGFAGSLLKRWRFPKEFIQTVMQHESRENAEDMEGGALVLNLANHMAYAMGHKIFDEDKAEPLEELPAYGLLKVTPDTVDKISQEVKSLMKETAHIF